MGFRFKLYRVITGIALMISGFFAFTGLSSILFLGVNTAFLLSLLVWGACFIHSVLSLYLQRSLLMPDVPLKENTPGGIRIMGAIVMIFSLLLIFVGVALLGYPAEKIPELTKMMPPEQQAVIQPGILKPMGGICLALGIILVVNANLSFRFLRQWQERQNSLQDEIEEIEEDKG